MNAVTCGAEMPALPAEPANGSVVLDVDGDAWQRRDDGDWHMALRYGSPDVASWGKLLALYGPLTLIHEPAEDGAE